jgi:hypothetical protein
MAQAALRPINFPIMYILNERVRKIEMAQDRK